MYTLVLTERAEADLVDALVYIRRELHNPQAAERLYDAFVRELDLIAEQPKIHPLVDDSYLLNHRIRVAPLGNYLLFYQADRDEQAVTIVRFLHGRRQWNEILKSRNQ